MAKIFPVYLVFVLWYGAFLVELEYTTHDIGSRIIFLV